MKIILKNDLPDGKNIKIKESNAGIFRNLTTLAPGHNYPLKHDLHATYREYFLIMLPDKTKLRVLTSDDFNDYKEISIYEATGVYDWRGVPRNCSPKVPVKASVNPPVNPPVPTSVPRPGQSGRGIVSTFFHKICIRS